MLFSPMMIVAAGATIAVAALDKTLDGLGYQWLGTILRIALPIAAFAAGIYFLETNPITTRWL